MPKYRLKHNYGGFPAGMIIEANSPERCSAMLSGIGELVPPMSDETNAETEGTQTASVPPIISPTEKPVSPFKKVKKGSNKMIRSAPKTK